MFTLNSSMIASITVLTLAACGTRPNPASKLQESPDIYNLRDQFGLTKPITWDEIKANRRIALTDIPWTDSYWPLMHKETAMRWGNFDSNSGEEVGLASFLRTYASESAKTEPSVGLSPAEKYDIVYQLRHGTSASEADVISLADAIAKLDEETRGLSELSAKRAKLISMRRTLANSPVALSLSLTSNAWDQFLGYSADEDYHYLGNDTSEGESWSWMGICHGWAPAAVMTTPPKHAAMAEIGGKKVLFTEGDIRGLLSRAWAQQAPSAKNFFLGRRCNKDVGNPNAAIPANSRGKGYAGNVTIDGRASDFTVIDALLDLNIKINGRGAGVYKIQLNESAVEKILIEAYGQGYYMVPNFTALVEYLRTSNIALLTKVKAEFTGCWDVNPASFHEVLVEQLTKRKTGFVMDRTRNGQVWNQPVYSANFTLGELYRVEAINDVASKYRASGTVYVAQVKAQVNWIAEPSSPQLVYPAGFDEGFSRASSYSYTLEFDANKKVIGGEWGTFAAMDPAAQAPDFLFGYETGAEPVDYVGANNGTAQIDYSGIIKKLLECSQSITTDGTTRVGRQSIAYKTCVIN